MANSQRTPVTHPRFQTYRTTGSDCGEEKENEGALIINSYNNNNNYYYFVVIVELFTSCHRVQERTQESLASCTYVHLVQAENDTGMRVYGYAKYHTIWRAHVAYSLRTGQRPSFKLGWGPLLHVTTSLYFSMFLDCPSNVNI